MELLELEIHDVAKRAKIAVWNDEGLSDFLDKCLRDVELRRVKDLACKAQ